MPKVKKRNLELCIVDVFVAIHKIKTYTALFENGLALQNNSLHWDATIRSFEVIGGALNYLLVDESFSARAPSYFKKIANFRNAIIHGYFGIDSDEVWDIITCKLEDLNDDLLAFSLKNFNLEEAIDLTIVEYSFSNEASIIHYLQKLKHLIE
jgi:uncharacterized protein with HEPN domain